MTGRHGPAFAFWLSYLDHHGGLWEQSGETVLAILPEQLSTKHDLPESASITDDPDIAREDGAMFLGAGNPEIHKGAEAIIEAGDVGALTLPHSAKQISTVDLLVKIRSEVPIDHGRIDATGSVIRSHRAQLRLAALVSHTVSADERFTEVAECVVDVPTRVAWARDVGDRLLHAVGLAEGTRGPDVAANTLVPALAAAHRELDDAAARRGRELSRDAEAERAVEITRATEYYAAALAAIDKRRGAADTDHRALLDARAQATVGERDRRLAEISEKYRHHHVLRPYRLHLVGMPVWRLATDVRRGERRWPMVFDYLPLLGIVAPTRCPTCGARSGLVATKTHLGCETCVPTTTPPLRVAPAVTQPRRESAAGNGVPTPGPARVSPQQQPRNDATSTANRKWPSSAVVPAPTAPSMVAPGAAGRPFLPSKPEERKVVEFWNQVGAGETRKVSRLVAADSPLAALTRLYGATGPLRGIGVPADHTPVSFTSGNYDRPVAGQRGGTGGELRTHHGTYPYLLLWSPDRLLDEVLPYSVPWHPGRAQTLLAPLAQVPPPRVDLDVVAQLLLTHVAARHSLTFAARALAAWWRLPDQSALLARFAPRVLAATVDRAIRYWSGVPGAGYADAATRFAADPADMRKATPILQKQLQLSVTRNW